MHGVPAGAIIADLLTAVLPEPLDVTESPQFVQLANDSGLFANEANAYLSAFADATPGVILVVRGQLPTTPDTGAGQSVVGDFDMRYFSITSNLNQKPYPTVAGDYDAELCRRRPRAARSSTSRHRAAWRTAVR